MTATTALVAAHHDALRKLGVSEEALALFAASDVVDLHVESFIWTRLFGYRLAKRHGLGPLRARLGYQVDLPRLLDAGLTGSVWSIATNPWRRRRRRTAIFLKNLQRLRCQLEAFPGISVVRDYAGYRRARAHGDHACWLAIQGGNALDSAAGDLAQVPDDCVSRITLVHMSNSSLGETSAPSGRWLRRMTSGLSAEGATFIEQINEKRIALDLAHISYRGFWQALEVHDRTQPAIVSHSGVNAVHRCWRNVEDDQIKAIAARGGVVGVIFHSLFLDGSLWGCKSERIVEHIAHIVDRFGDDYVALGSDWDGMIVTPRDMKTVLELPLLVQRMLDRGWTAERIAKILGGNYLRVIKQLRPGG